MVLLHHTFKVNQPVHVEKPLKCYSTAHSLRLQNSSETERLRFLSGSLPPTAGHVCFCRLQHASWELKTLKRSSSEQQAKKNSLAGHLTSNSQDRTSCSSREASPFWGLQKFIPSTSSGCRQDRVDRGHSNIRTKSIEWKEEQSSSE